ncbi:MAG: hypothetical protein QXI95_02445 [Candidatus Micrarchaeaceae archaeon]
MSNTFLNPFTNELISIPSNINLTTSNITASQINSNTINMNGEPTNFQNTKTNIINMINTGSKPYFLHVDGLGYIWVSNFGSGTVQKFNSNQELIATYTVGTNPLDIIEDSNHNIFVVCFQNGIYKITQAGVVTSTTANAANLGTIAIDTSNNIYVSNNNAFYLPSKEITSIYVLNTDLTTTSSNTSYAFSAYSNICSYAEYGFQYNVDSGQLYIFEGTSTYSATNAINLSFYNSLYISKLPNGNFIIIAPYPSGTTTVYILTIDFSSLTASIINTVKFSTVFQALPFGVDSNNNLYFAQKNNTILKTDVNLNILETINLDFEPYSIAIDSNNNLWIGGSGSQIGFLQPTVETTVLSITPTNITTSNIALTQSLKIVGTTTGTITLTQPEVGVSKKVLLNCVSYSNTTSIAQSISFPTYFSYSNYITFNNTGMSAILTNSKITLPKSMSSSAHGMIIIEGF